MAPAVRPSFRHVWPIPALVLALALFGAGLVVAFTKRPRPDPALPLMQANSLIETQRFPEAVDFINAQVKPFFDQGLLSQEQERDYHLSIARAFAGALQAAGYGVPFNHQVVVESFHKADKLGADLSSPDISLLVTSLLALGRTDDAIARINKLPESESPRRARLIKSVAESALAAVSADEHGPKTGAAAASAAAHDRQALDLLATLSGTVDLPTADRAWVLARQAELLLRAGNTDEAINKLIRRIGLLRDIPGEQQGELYLLLGRAYFQADPPQLTPAAKQLEVAEALLPQGSPLRAETGLILGRIAQERGQLDSARDRFLAVMNEFGSSRVYAPALLSLAEVLAANRDAPADQLAALEKYAELADLVRHHRGLSNGVSRDAVASSLMQRYDERAKAALSDEAVRFALLAESLYRENEVPAPVLLAIGRSHRALADELMAQARATWRGNQADFRVEDLDPATRAEVKREYLDAGHYLRRHAITVAPTSIEEYARSLWEAAESFDLGGDLDEARKAFQQYADGAADNDPNKPAARFRLAEVCQAQHEHATAEALFRSLVNARSRADATSPAGRWGEQAVVPLAQCLLADANAGNDAEAERLLSDVVDGSELSPESVEYREALVELGTMYYHAGRYPEAIARLEQAVERYPEDRRRDALRYRLADSHRLEAARVHRTLAQALPQSQRDELERLRTEHLVSARRMFEQVTAVLGAIDAARLSSDEEIYLRNAFFYIGDCAYEMRDFDAAVAAYDTARLRYSASPASMVAMAQIVSAYAAQGRWAEARTANERARQQLERFPESIWQSADLPMEKKHWERWLDARTQLEKRALPSAPTGPASATGNSGEAK